MGSIFLQKKLTTMETRTFNPVFLILAIIGLLLGIIASYFYGSLSSNYAKLSSQYNKILTENEALHKKVNEFEASLLGK